LSCTRLFLSGTLRGECLVQDVVHLRPHSLRTNNSTERMKLAIERMKIFTGENYISVRKGGCRQVGAANSLSVL
jgi:cytoskeletal protein CcmA (bactofilin family)